MPIAAATPYGACEEGEGAFPWARFAHPRLAAFFDGEDCVRLWSPRRVVHTQAGTALESVDVVVVGLQVGICVLRELHR